MEDIINLVAINVKIIKPGMMEAYYARLTEVFAFSDESILHCGYAWYKLFNLARKYNKTLVHVDIQMLASNVLLTALSVRPYTRGPLRPGNERSDQTRERQKRLANILGFGLVRDITPGGVFCLPGTALKVGQTGNFILKLKHCVLFCSSLF